MSSSRHAPSTRTELAQMPVADHSEVPVGPRGSRRLQPDQERRGRADRPPRPSPASGRRQPRPRRARPRAVVAPSPHAPASTPTALPGAARPAAGRHRSRRRGPFTVGVGGVEDLYPRPRGDRSTVRRHHDLAGYRQHEVCRKRRISGQRQSRPQLGDIGAGVMQFDDQTADEGQFGAACGGDPSGR